MAEEEESIQKEISQEIDQDNTNCEVSDDLNNF